MCQPRGISGSKHPSGCTCGCCGCGCGPSFRRFYSSREVEECLQNYRDQVQKELAGVEERLEELKGE